ncbi:hypothetical protein ABS755_07355 [Castellaniella sp. FW104-16D08]|uniref:hypothetical protein n=1 Tax=unclassified Castellaniella TaxID=2617606 RepID=UPI0033151B0C
MSVQSDNRVAGPFDGNGLTTNFSFEFTVFQASDVLAIKTGTDDIELPLKKDVDYTVTLNDSTEGGTVILTTPLETGSKLTLTSQLDATQGLKIPNLSSFLPETVERALDKLTILVQQLADKVSRTVQAPISGGTSASQLLEQLAEQLPLVAAVYTHLAYIKAVSENQANVDTVAVSIDPINAIAADMAGSWAAGVTYDFGSVGEPPAGGTTSPLGNIVTVAGHIANVDTVAGGIADVGTVSLNISAVNAVAADLASVNSVVANEANINTVAADLLNINSVAASIGNVDAVAADLTNIGAVLADKANIDAVAGNKVNIDAVAGNKVNIDAAVSNQANINAVVANATNVNTVAGSIGNVDTVAASNVAVGAVATDLQGAPVAIDYGSVADPAANPATPTGVLASVYSNASDISTAASNMAAIQNVSANMASILAALSGAVAAANNLSELTDPAAARANLGLADMGGLA